VSEDERTPMPPAVLPPRASRLGARPASPAWLWWVIGVGGVWLSLVAAMAVGMGSGRS